MLHPLAAWAGHISHRLLFEFVPRRLCVVKLVLSAVMLDQLRDVGTLGGN